MYWNSSATIATISGWLINRNMRCIEIGTATAQPPAELRLIETWDVLKFFSTPPHTIQEAD